jgi:thiol-disulfide isomerase/thioredoxin
MVLSRRVRALLPCLALLAAACGSAGMPPSEHPLMQKAPAPRKEAALDGSLVSLPVPGKVTVLDFWATTCKPCAELMPAIEKLYEQKHEGGVEVIGIAIDDNPGKVQNRISERGVTYATVMDPNSQIQGAYQVTELPQTFVFDKTGKLRFFTKGGTLDDVAKIERAVDVLLAE